MSATPLSRETLGLLLGFLGVVVFGGTLPFTRLAVEALDPWFVTTGRAAAAGLLAGATLLLLRRPVPEARTLRTLALAAACLVFAFPAFIGFAMRTLPAAHGGVVLGILPLATAAAGAWLLGERPSGAFWVSAALGSAIVVAFALRDGGGRLETGDALLLGAVLSTAVGYALSAEVAGRMGGWEVISWQLVLALPITAPVALWFMPPAPADIPAVSWLGFAYVALFSQYLGFFAWNAGLALGGVARVGQVQLLQTFVTLGLAALLNGERVDLATWLAAIAVVALVVIGRRARVARTA